MINLTTSEKEIIQRKRDLINNAMLFHHRSITPVIKSIINRGLIKLAKENRIEFITSMYIDYVENLVDFYSGNLKDYKSKYNIYYNCFHFNDSKHFNKNLLIYSRFLLQHYYTDSKEADDNLVLNLRRTIKDSIGEFKNGIDHYALANAHEKLMAYILSSDEILLNKDLWEELIKYLKNNIDDIYANFLLNSEEGYMSRYIDDHFFDPKQLVKEYQNRDYKKVIK